MGTNKHQHLTLSCHFSHAHVESDYWHVSGRGYVKFEPGSVLSKKQLGSYQQHCQPY